MTGKLDTIGKLAMYTVLAEDEEREDLVAAAVGLGYRLAPGRVGSMDLNKVIAAIETAARRGGIASPTYPEDHALYHAILEALHGIGRGQLALGTLLRTVGLRFVVIAGPQVPGNRETGEWVAVAMYGTIGGPIKGNEHECMGLGISHL